MNELRNQLDNKHEEETRVTAERALRELLTRRRLPCLGEFSADSLFRNPLWDPLDSESIIVEKVGRFVDEQSSPALQRLTGILESRARYRYVAMGNGLTNIQERCREIVQQAMLKWQEKFADFKGDSESAVISWFYTTIERALLDIARGRGPDKREQGWRSIYDLAEAWSTSAGINLEDRLAEKASSIARRKEASDLVVKAIEQLDDDLAEIVVMHMNDMTLEQISQATGYSKSTVARKYHAALGRLRDLLDGKV